MTPKEKAKDLVEKYDFMYIQNYTSMFDIKQCALIAVDLAIEVETNIFKGKVNKSFWQEVKQEIEKI
jgi:hypothetical protein